MTFRFVVNIANMNENTGNNDNNRYTVVQVIS